MERHSTRDAVDAMQVPLMQELYIYYRIDAVDEAAVTALVQSFQARLTAGRPSLNARMLIRADSDAAGQRTCMETYASERQPYGVGDDDLARVAAEATVLEPLLRSPRHVERFTRLPVRTPPSESPTACFDMPTTAKPFTLLLRVRYGECDAQQVVFNARYGDYADIAMAEYLREIYGNYQQLLDAGIDTQVVRLATDFSSPARFDDVIAISVETSAIGNTSFALTILMREHVTGRLLATTNATYVAVRARVHEKIRVPDDMRLALQRGGSGVVIDHAGIFRSTAADGGR